MIKFDNIPTSIRKPGQYLETNWTNAVSTLPSGANRCLIIATIGTGATVATSTLVQIFSSTEADVLFGSDSVAAKMVKACLKANPSIDLTVCPLAAGATSLVDALPVIMSGGHSMIATQFMDEPNSTVMRDYIALVASPIEQRPAYLFAAVTDSFADATTYATKANDGRMNICYLRGTTTPPAELAAIYMAAAASEDDPARPLNTLELKGVALPSVNNYLTRTEQETLLKSGVTPLECTADGRVRIVRAVTTYTKNAQGVDDPCMLDITSVRSADYVRLAVRTAVSLQFPRSKMSRKVIGSVWATIYATLKKLEDSEIVQNVDDHRDGIVLEPSKTEAGTLNAAIPTPIIPGFHVFAGRLDIIL